MENETAQANHDALNDKDFLLLNSNASYPHYRDVFKGRRMPFAFVDLDAFDENTASILRRAGAMPLCVATKSLRCVALIRRILSASAQFHSIMAYSAREAVYLSEQGFDSILVAYPVLGEAEHSPGLADALGAGKRITLMVDCAEHVRALDALGAAAGCVIPVCMDVDMSSRYPGLHFGVLRSSIDTADGAVSLFRHIQQCRHIRLDGVMGYEAQIAGLQDRAPGALLKNLLVRILKSRSVGEVRRRRAAVVAALREAGAELRFVNAGGTGSIETSVQEPVVTEVTVGSGFYSPALFDHYSRFHHIPAAGYAIEVVRCPAPGVYTCQGGGYPASGAGGRDRLPRPWLPEGACLSNAEGAGEVQTPIRYSGETPLKPGDPVFMRHAKAGELCERFNTLLLVSGGAVVDEVPTYRGEGLCFL